MFDNSANLTDRNVVATGVSKRSAHKRAPNVFIFVFAEQHSCAIGIRIAAF
jgi:hypothetical protein